MALAISRELEYQDYPTHTQYEGYLSKSTQLHDDPHWVLCDHADQLNNVRMVKLTHCHCKEKRL